MDPRYTKGKNLAQFLLVCPPRSGSEFFFLFSPLLPPTVYGANNKGNRGGGDTCDDISKKGAKILTRMLQGKLFLARDFSPHTHFHFPPSCENEPFWSPPLLPLLPPSYLLSLRGKKDGGGGFPTRRWRHGGVLGGGGGLLLRRSHRLSIPETGRRRRGEKKNEEKGVL